MLRKYIENACEQIDAALFNGDAFVGNDKDAREHREILRKYMARWERQLKSEEMQPDAV